MIDAPLLRLTHQDKTVLAVATGLAPESLEGLQVVKNYRAAGFCWNGETVVEWMPEGVLIVDNHLLVRGPDLPGFVASQPGTKPEALWQAAAGLARLFRHLAQAGHLPEKLTSHQVIFGRGGQILLLPYALASRLYGLKTAASDSQWAPLLHPQARGLQAAAFLAASVFFHALAGRPAYPAEATPEATAEVLRRLRLPPAAQALPGLLPALGPVLDRCLAARALPDDLAQLADLTAGGRTSVQTALPEAEQTRLLQKAAKTEAARRAALARRQWLHRHRLGLGLGVVGLSFALIMSGLLFVHAPAEAGASAGPASAEDVVAAYYAALSKPDPNSLNQLVSAGPTPDPTVARDIDEAMRFFVKETVRIQLNPLGGGEYLPAQAWKDEGARPIPEGAEVYGVAELKLTRLAEDRWQADYEKWFAVSVKTGKNPALTQRTGERRQDVVQLVQTGGQWKVAAVVRTAQALRP